MRFHLSYCRRGGLREQSKERERKKLQAIIITFIGLGLDRACVSGLTGKKEPLIQYAENFALTSS